MKIASRIPFLTNMSLKSVKANIIIFVGLLLFFLGLYVYCTQRIRFENFTDAKYEALQNRTKEPARCPNVLVKRGNQLYLYNTTDRNDAIPMHFNNLDEYIDFVNKQREQGIHCPILYLQEENDVQGNDVYRVRPSPFDLQGGMQPVNGKGQAVMDASRDGSEYNKNMFHGFDPYGQHVGVVTELDDIHKSTGKNGASDNPMDTNWGGVEHTQESVESGKYEGRQVTKPTYFSPSAQFIPGLGERVPPPSFISSSGTAV